MVTSKINSCRKTPGAYLRRLIQSWDDFVKQPIWPEDMAAQRFLDKYHEKVLIPPSLCKELLAIADVLRQCDQGRGTR